MKKTNYKNYPQRFQEMFELGSDSLMETKAITKDYEKMGFTKDDLPALWEIALDKELEYFDADGDKIPFAPPHAMMALAQLKLKEPLEDILERIEFFEDDDYYTNAALRYFEAVGYEKVDSLIEFFLDQKKVVYNRMMIIEALEKLFEKYPDIKPKIEEALLLYLRRDDGDEEDDDGLNAMVIHSLLDVCDARKHIELIRKVFVTKPVDVFFDGDLEDIEIKLGFRKERTTKMVNILDFFMQNEYEDEDEFEDLSKNEKKVGRNEPCPCGSGKKYKKCCLQK